MQTHDPQPFIKPGFINPAGSRSEMEYRLDLLLSYGSTISNVSRAVHSVQCTYTIYVGTTAYYVFVSVLASNAAATLAVGYRRRSSYNTKEGGTASEWL
jgi:hypothetical protein